MKGQQISKSITVLFLVFTISSTVFSGNTPGKMTKEVEEKATPESQKSVEAASSKRSGSHIASPRVEASPQKGGSCLARSIQAPPSPHRSIPLRHLANYQQFITLILNKCMPNSLIGYKNAQETSLVKSLYNYCSIIAPQRDHLLFDYLASIDAALRVTDQVCCNYFEKRTEKAELLSAKECFRAWGNALSTILYDLDAMNVAGTPNAGKLILDTLRISLIKQVRTLALSSSKLSVENLIYIHDTLMSVLELVFEMACNLKTHEVGEVADEFVEVNLAPYVPPYESPELTAIASARFNKSTNSPQASATNSPRNSRIALVDFEVVEHEHPFNEAYEILLQEAQVQEILPSLTFCARFLLFSRVLEEKYKQVDALTIKSFVKVPA